MPGSPSRNLHSAPEVPRPIGAPRRHTRWHFLQQSQLIRLLVWCLSICNLTPPTAPMKRTNFSTVSLAGDGWTLVSFHVRVAEGGIRGRRARRFDASSITMSVDQKEFLQNLSIGGLSDRGWTKTISHHLETSVSWYLPGNRILPRSLRFEMDFATIHRSLGGGQKRTALDTSETSS